MSKDIRSAEDTELRGEDSEKEAIPSESSSERGSKPVYRSIDVLDDPVSDSQSAGYMQFEPCLDTIAELPVLVQYRLLTKAYSQLTSLQVKSGSASWNSSQGELRFEDCLDMVRGALERVEKQYSTLLSPDGSFHTLLQAAKLIFDQLEICAKTNSETEARELELKAENIELLKRCEMMETRASLLYDRLKSVEAGVPKVEGSGGIDEDIARKEAQMELLQQELRRLKSRKVLQNISARESLGAKGARKGRCSSAYAIRSKAISSGSPRLARISPSIPLMCHNCKASLLPGISTPSPNRLQLLQSELNLSLKRLITEKAKVRDLENALMEVKVRTTKDTADMSTYQGSITVGRELQLVTLPGVEVRMKRLGMRSDRGYCCPSF